MSVTTISAATFQCWQQLSSSDAQKRAQTLSHSNSLCFWFLLPVCMELLPTHLSAKDKQAKKTFWMLFEYYCVLGSQKSTLDQDAFQKVGRFSPGQNWDLQCEKNSIKKLTGKSGHNCIVSNKGCSDYCSFDLKSLHL